MKIGFHIPFTGNLKRLTTRVEKTRGNAFQFYSRSMRGAVIPKITDKQLMDYYDFLLTKRVSTVVMLSPLFYKLRANVELSANLAVKNPEAIEEVLKDLEYARMVQARYFVVNAGYAKGASESEAIAILKEQLEEILSRTEWTGTILVRNMSGGGTEIAGNLFSWKQLIDFHPRIKGALDLGRAYAYGYNFIKDSEARLLSTLLAKEIGWENIALVYINDTNRFCGSKRDDAAPLGFGVINWHGYKQILTDEHLLKKVWMVENQPDATYYDSSIRYLLTFHENSK